MGSILPRPKVKLKRPAKPCKSRRVGGEGGIRTHGTVTRTTVFETASDNGVPRLKDRMIKVQTTLVAGPGCEPTLCPWMIWRLRYSDASPIGCVSALRTEAPLQAPVLLNAIALRCSVFQLSRSRFDRAGP